MATQDFTNGWTEVDPGGTLSQSGGTSTFTSLTRNATAYLYRAVECNGDFEIWFDYTNTAGTGGSCLLCFATDKNDYISLDAANGSAVGVRQYLNDLTIYELSAGSYYGTTAPQNITLDSTFYFKFIRTEGDPSQLILKSYASSADRASDTSATTYTHNMSGADNNFTYALFPTSRNDGNNNTISGRIENLEFVSGVTVEEPASPLSINVYDTAACSDSEPSISVEEAAPEFLEINITDDITVSDSEPSVFFGLENQIGDFVVTMTVVHEISVSDGAAVSDAPEGQVDPLPFSVSETVSVVDVHTIEGPELYVDVSDDAAISEAVTQWIVHEPVVDDAFSCTEEVSMALDDLQINISENVSVVDSPDLDVGMETPIIIGEWAAAEFKGFDVHGQEFWIRGKFRYL